MIEPLTAALVRPDLIRPPSSSIAHAHIAARKMTGPAKTSDLRVKGKGPIGRLNARFGVVITVAVGTMWCAYLFTVVELVSLPAALQSHDKNIIIGWIAQTFLQLVLLPIIVVGRRCGCPRRRVRGCRGGRRLGLGRPLRC
jgi:hypothetical protein